MNYPTLLRLKNKLYFSSLDLAKVMGIKPASANVLASRYVKKGLLIRLKKNFYLLPQKWESLRHEEFFRIANCLQVPSYISLLTALSYYGVSTQVQRNFWECVSLKRTRKISAAGHTFQYFKVKKELYFSFEQKNGMFIATKEKAFVDALYLNSIGKYPLDISALDPGKLNKKLLAAILGKYPAKTKEMAKRICKI